MRRARLSAPCQWHVADRPARPPLARLETDGWILPRRGTRQGRFAWTELATCEKSSAMTAPPIWPVAALVARQGQ